MIATCFALVPVYIRLSSLLKPLWRRQRIKMKTALKFP